VGASLLLPTRRVCGGQLASLQAPVLWKGEPYWVMGLKGKGSRHCGLCVLQQQLRDLKLMEGVRCATCCSMRLSRPLPEQVWCGVMRDFSGRILSKDKTVQAA